MLIGSFDCFHAVIKLLTGQTEGLAVLAVAEHKKIQEFIKMVLQLPG